MAGNPLSTIGGSSGDAGNNPLSSIGAPSYSGGSSGTDSVDGLLTLAQEQGGAVAVAANELVHPRTGILSTIGDGLKHAFRGFVNTLAVPSEIVAGTLSSDLTVGEAIDQHKRVSDVLFGNQDENASTMQKVGSFFVRTAVDVMTDPLTYVTFGAGQGLMGLRALPKVQLYQKAAAQVGKEAMSSAALSQEGADVFKFLKNVEYQARGMTVAESLKAGSSAAYELGKKELDDLLKVSIDAPLSQDFARTAMSNLLEKFPYMAETLIDEGGIKFFGKSIVSGQRVSSALKLIPGMTLLDDATLNMRRSVQALFDPALIKISNKWTRLPEEMVDLMNASSDLATSLKDTYTKRLVDIVRANKLNVNEASFVRDAIEARKIPADARLANAYKQFLQFSEDQYQFLVKSGINLAHLDNHVPHILLKEDMSSDAFMGLLLPPKQKVEAAMQRKAGDTIAEARANGFNMDENVVTAHLQRTMDNVESGVAKRFMRDVAQMMGRPVSEAPAEWRSVAIGGVTEEGKKILSVMNLNKEEMVFHPAVAARIEKFIGSVVNDDATRDLLKAFDKVQGLWKASVTSIFPAFHGRNALSNVFQNLLDLGMHALDPAKHAMSVQLITYDRQANKLATAAAGIGEAADQAKEELAKLLETPVFTDVAGHPWTFGEVRTVAKNRGIAFTKNITGPLDVAQTHEERVAALFPEYMDKASKVKTMAKKVLPISQEFKPFEVGREVGRAVEEHGRLLNFVANLRNTGDVTLAANRTKQFLFDYGNLTNFEKTFLRRLIPFYTFTRKNLELQVQTLLTAPGRVEAELTALSNLGEVISGGQPLNDKEYDALPDWIKSGISLMKNRNGNLVEMYSSLGTPIEAPFQALQPNSLLGSISPLLRIPFEQMTGYSLFQGKPLSEVTNAAAFKRAPRAIKEFIGYSEMQYNTKNGKKGTLYIALRPERMNLLLNLPPTSRVLSAMKQMDAVDVSTQSKILQQLVGVRPFSFDLELEAKKRQNELKKQLEDMLTQARVTAQFTKTYVPKE